MISPDPQNPTPAPVVDRVEAFFGPGGGLESACRDRELAYEFRPQQLAMAREVADVVDAGEHLVVEAGTGVGKSFAYLAPIILSALARQVKVVVSTYTISLQEQLMVKDLPFLRAHLGEDFRAVMVKGRTNYLCLRRLARARRMGEDMFRTGQAVELETLRAWADVTLDGSLQDLEVQPSSDVWSMVCAEQGNCLYQKCPEYAQCFFLNARKRMAEADVLVVNHHLFFSDLALRASGASFLPAFDMVVLDEAHMVESVATDHLGLRLTERMLERWLSRLFSPEANKGLLAVLRAGEAAHGVTRVRETAGLFFAALRKWAGFEAGRNQKVVTDPLAVDVPLMDDMKRLLVLVQEVTDATADEEMAAELTSLQRRGEAMRDHLGAYLAQSMEDQVYWMEQTGRLRNLALRSAPVEVGPTLRIALFEEIPCVVLTSATLAVNRDLAYFQHRIGAGDCRGLRVGSPFDFGRQMRVYLAGQMPDPNQLDAYAPAAAAQILRFVNHTQGGAFVLFTSARMMQRVAEEAKESLSAAGYPLWVQGEGPSRHQMLEQFKQRPTSVLFGLDSFWTGVDVRGEALRNVIIARLPFAVPSHPVVACRMARIRDQGGDPFRDYSLPEAILRFRQGVGRLIRTGQDDGIVVVLDPRICEKWYGRLFLAALPECPVEVVDGSDETNPPTSGA